MTKSPHFRNLPFSKVFHILLHEHFQRATAKATIEKTLIIAILGWFIVACENPPKTPQVDVNWEHITNFTDQKDVFESKFTLTHRGGADLNASNWALFFNIAPRKIVPTADDQPAIIEHLNGDWYRMAPAAGFSMSAGESIAVYYRGIEAIIKESDRPLGLYFVFYDENGAEKEIAEVKNYSYSPFTRPEQINRSEDDYDPIPSPTYLYQSNQKLFQLPKESLSRILPTPRKMKTQAGSLTVGTDFMIVCDASLTSEAQYLKEMLLSDFGLTLSVSESGHDGQSISLRLRPMSIDGIKKECYQLTIDSSGISIVGSDASGVFYGIQSLRSLMPIEALKEQKKEIALNYVEITDAPRFHFRSLQLDVGRNFQSKQSILRLLDVMALYKLNNFLFYLTEDEGWRLEIEPLPELTAVGAHRRHTGSFRKSVLHPAYGSGPFATNAESHGNGHYSREDFIEILRYAHSRHIQVIPEVNLPGHARAAIKAMEYRYERLLREGKAEEAEEYRLIDPNDTSRYMSAQFYKDNTACVVRESTYKFYETVVNEIISMYQDAGVPISKFHLGGDEVPEGAWSGSPLTADFMKQHPEIENLHALHAYFIEKITDRLAHLELEWHGWEEVALKKSDNGAYEPNEAFVGKGIVPYIWNNLFEYPDMGYKLANIGYPVVLCNVSNFYFDLAYNKDPKEPGLYWAGFINERDNWTFAPFNMYRSTSNTSMGHQILVQKTEKRQSRTVDIARITPGDFPPLELERLDPEAFENIVGLQAQIWSETIKGGQMLEYYYLPKLPAFAESAWAAERHWEAVADDAQRFAMQEKGWNTFANQLANKELPRLRFLNGGYNYRLPPPGAIVEDGYLKANVEYPGLYIDYALAKEMSTNSLEFQQYVEPVKLEKGATIHLKSRDVAGSESRIVSMQYK
jgi:hexosaminidase